MLLIAGALLDATGRLLAALRLSPASIGDRLAIGRALAMALGLLVFAWQRMHGDPTPLVLGVATVAVMLAEARERLALRLFGGDAVAPGWIADVDALVLLFLPFALAQQTLAGLLALGVYAAASFGAVQQRLLQRAHRDAS